MKILDSRSNQKLGVIVVDMQWDFLECKAGKLAVPGTDDEFLIRVYRRTKSLHEQGHIIIATQDWHPKDHISFRSWPEHCVQGAQGAVIMIDNNLFRAVVQKGSNPILDSYSGFEDELEFILRSNDLDRLIIYGLATEFCVKETVLAALYLGFDVLVVKDLCKGITKETVEEAFKKMEDAGAQLFDFIS